MNASEECSKREALLLNLLNQTSGFYEDTIGVLSGIFKLSEYVRKGSPEQEFYAYLVNVLLEESRCENASVFMIQGDKLVLMAADGSGQSSNKRVEIPLGEGVAGRCAKEGHFLLVSDTQNCEFFSNRPDTKVRLRSMLCVPIKESGQTIGVLNLSHSQPDFFSVHDVRIFELLGLLVGQMLTLLSIYDVFRREYIDLEQAMQAKDADLKTISASYRSVVDTSDDMILLTDGREVKFFNKALISALGRAPEKLGDIFEAEIESDILMRIAKLAEDEGCERELTINIGEKHSLICQLMVKRILDQQALIILRDITEKRKLEQRQMQTEKLASLGMLTSGIAHELNNKLTPILGFAELIDTSELQAKDRDRFAVIVNAADSARNIIESLLTFSRNVPPQKSVFNIDDLIERTINLYRPTMRKRSIEIQHQPGDDPLMLQADLNCMEQVLVNLINNAVDAIGDNPGRINILSRRQHEHVVIQIADNGPGIPEHVMPKIFDPFFSTKGVDCGTGLGLSICYGIISDHKGEIVMENTDEGAQVTLRMPPHKGGSHECEHPSSEDSMSTQQASGDGYIMVVEDEDDLRELIEDALEPYYTTVSFCNGREALNNLAERNWQLIISDLRMPEVDGMELFREAIRLNPSLEPRFLFTTGDTYDLQVKDFLEETGVDYLKKPFRIKELLGRIEQRIESSRG